MEQIKPVTTTTVISGEAQWKLGGIDLEDWSDEVTMPNPALLK